MKTQGGKMIDGIFLAMLICIGVYGVWRYYSAETNTYVEVKEHVDGMQNEIHSNAESIGKCEEAIRVLKNRVDNLEHKLGETKTALEAVKKEATDEINKSQDHLALLRKDVQRIDAKPSRLELVLDTPEKPIPVDVSSKNVGLRTLVTKKKIIKNKNAKGKWDGSWTVFQKSIARPYNKRKDKPKTDESKEQSTPKPIPGARSAKQAMRDADFG